MEKNRKKPNSDLLWNLTKYGFFFFFSLNDVSFLLCKKKGFFVISLMLSGFHSLLP